MLVLVSAFGIVAAFAAITSMVVHAFTSGPTALLVTGGICALLLRPETFLALRRLQVASTAEAEAMAKARAEARAGPGVVKAVQRPHPEVPKKAIFVAH